MIQYNTVLTLLAELGAGLGNLTKYGDLFKAFVAHKLGLHAAHNTLIAVQQVAAGFI
jgi:hypothetical protein